MSSAVSVLAWCASTPGIQAIAVFLLVIVPATWFVYNVTLHPLAGFPGPLLYRGSNIPKVATQMRGNITHKIHELHQTYGPVVRIAPWELSYISAQAWKDIYTGRKGKDPMPCNAIYGHNEKEFFGDLSLMWQPNAVEHTRHRRIISPVFSDKSLREQEPIITKHVALFMRRMRENAGTVVDLCAWFNYSAFDIIGDLTFGEPFHCLEKSQNHPWITFIFARLKALMYAQIIDSLGPLGTGIRMMIPRRVKEAVYKHVAYSREKVTRRCEKVTDRPDFMTHIIKHVGVENGLTSNELLANAQILVIAGSEPSATLLSTATYYLMRNPSVKRKLEHEVRSAFSDEGQIDFAGISKLPYLLAVLNESLRIHPPVPVGIHRFSPPGGAIIDGRYVAGGTDVAVHQWSAYRSAANFTDPDAFVPERWLPGQDERYLNDNKDVFQPFSIGPRNCIGRGLAYMESRLVLARIIWNFDMELMPESAQWAVQKTWVLYEKHPLMARLRTV